MQILLLIVVLSCKFWVHHTWLIPNIQHSASVMPHRTLRITQGVQMSCDRRAHQAQKAAVSYIIHPPILHVSPSSELSIVCCCTCGVPIGHALRDQLRQLDDMRSSSASGECICVVPSVRQQRLSRSSSSVLGGNAENLARTCIAGVNPSSS